jgi:putative endonuclease
VCERWVARREPCFDRTRLDDSQLGDGQLGDSRLNDGRIGSQPLRRRQLDRPMRGWNWLARRWTSRNSVVRAWLRGGESRGRRWLLALWPAALARLPSRGDRELGLLGEELAARWLLQHGYAVLARGKRYGGVEVDVLARRGAVHVLVEVKTARLPELEGSGRLDARFRPGLRFDARRLRRLQRARVALRRALPCDPQAADTSPGKSFRIDLVEVGLGPRGRIEVRHHADLRRPFAPARSNAGLDAAVGF